MQPRRKEAVCLDTSPVKAESDIFHESTARPESRRGNGGNQLSCKFTTFKGRPGTASETGDGTKAARTDRQREEKHAISSSALQAMSFDEIQLRDESPVEPITLKRSKAEQDAESQPAREPFKFAGFFGTILSSLFTSLGVLCIKLLPVEDSFREKAKACMFRGAMLVILSSASIWCRGLSFKVPRGEYLINLIRAVVGSVNILLIFCSVQFITIGESSALVYSSPLWTCLLGRLLLKEPLPAILVLVIPMSLLGLVFLAHPDLLVDVTEELPADFARETSNSSLEDQLRNLTLSAIDATGQFAQAVETADDDPELFFRKRLPGIIIALSASFSLSTVIIVLKFRKLTPIEVCSFYTGIAQALISVGIQLVVGFGAMPASWLEWLLHLLIGLSSFGIQQSFQWALQFISAGTFSVVRSLDIALGFVLGALFLQEVVLWTSIVGSILIMLVVVLLMLDDYFAQYFKSMWRS